MRHFILIFETLNQAGNLASYIYLGDFTDAVVINIQFGNTGLFFLPTRKPICHFAAWKQCESMC